MFSNERQLINSQKISRLACSYPKWLALAKEGIQNIDFVKSKLVHRPQGNNA